MSSLNRCRTVHKRYRAASHWQNGRGWPRSEVAIESPYTDISGLISDAWQLTALLHYGFMSALTPMSPTLLFIHSLLPKLLTRLSFMRAGVKNI